MTAAGTTDVEALRSLTSTLIDSANGYEEAASTADDPSFQAEFRRLARERKGVVEEFRRHIAGLGGEAEVSGSTGSALHRAFMNLRSLFQSDTKTAIAEVERGEDHLKAEFESVLDNTGVSPDIRNFIRTAYARVRFDHDRWSALKRTFQAN